MSRVACIDLFCGAGGLTHGLIQAGIPVVAGIDVDEPTCDVPCVRRLPLPDSTPWLSKTESASVT